MVAPQPGLGSWDACICREPIQIRGRQSRDQNAVASWSALCASARNQTNVGAAEGSPWRSAPSHMHTHTTAIRHFTSSTIELSVHPGGRHGHTCVAPHSAAHTVAAILSRSALLSAPCRASAYPCVRVSVTRLSRPPDRSALTCAPHAPQWRLSFAGFVHPVAHRIWPGGQPLLRSQLPLTQFEPTSHWRQHRRLGDPPRSRSCRSSCCRSGC